MISLSVSFLPQAQPFVRISSATHLSCEKSTTLKQNGRFTSTQNLRNSLTPRSVSVLASSICSQIFQKSIPFAASISFLIWSSPANAGFLSGFSGIESVPGPQLPQIDFLNRLNEENQKKYAEFDAKFKSSPLLKQLLERSKLNKEKNRQQILDKYCIRGAEWGVGDCSAEGMSPQERENFIATLKQKAGITE